MQVLVVEDDEAIRETLQLALESHDYEVRTAANGAEGLAALRTDPLPCLILLDLMMPVMNGWEFAQRLHADPKWAHIPIIALTAYADQSIGQPFHEVIKKPFDLRTLITTVDRYCKR